MMNLRYLFAKKYIQPLHRVIIWDRRVKTLSRSLGYLLLSGVPLTGLDVGCGNGEIANSIHESHGNIDILGTDVLVRKGAHINVIGFDGKKLPFKDKSFDFTMLIDVLHHTDDPANLIRECRRVSRKFILLKDHICDSWWDRRILHFMDWVGNRAYDVTLRYNFLSKDDWNKLFKESDLECEDISYTLNLYPKPLSILLDGHLHFLARLSVP